MARDTIDLNGTWKIRFDPGDRGIAERWFAQGTFGGEPDIRVPATWDEIRHGQDLCAVPVGQGRIVFVCFRVADEIATDPAARRLLWNLLTR